MQLNIVQLFITSFLLLMSLLYYQSSRGQDHSRELKFLSLEEIRSAISGNWQVHYSVGGLSRQQYLVHRKTYLNFEPNDTVCYTWQNVKILRGKIKWINRQNIFGEKTHLMDIGFTPMWIVEKIDSDTLRIRDNAHDGFTHVLTRKRE